MRHRHCLCCWEACACLSGSEKRKPAAPYVPDVIREAKNEYYRHWLDMPIPLLGGKTPRAAARAKKSREQLEVLLRDIENKEGRLPVKERFDIRQIRAELGMDE